MTNSNIHLFYTKHFEFFYLNFTFATVFVIASCIFLSPTNQFYDDFTTAQIIFLIVSTIYYISMFIHFILSLYFLFKDNHSQKPSPSEELEVSETNPI